MSIRNLHILILVSVGYVAAQMVADISNLRNVMLFGYAVTGFSIAYPLTFTLRDMAHKLAGPVVARTLILAAAVIYLIVQAFFAIISGISPAMTEEERITLGALLTPEWRFLMAAVVASVISQLVDTEIYTRWVNRFGAEHQWGRVLVSNIIGIPLDRILFLLDRISRRLVARGILGGLHRHLHRAHRLRHHFHSRYLPGRGTLGGLDPHRGNPPYRSALIRAQQRRLAGAF